jgi:hypothetical protein
MDKKNLKKNYIYIVILVAVLGIVVWAGIKFFKSSKGNQNSQTNSNSQNQGFRGGGNRAGFNRIHGTVSSISQNGLVMKADDGSTKNVVVSTSTRIMKEKNGQPSQIKLSDIKTGDEITVMSSSASGDLQARMIMDGQFTFNRSQNGSFPNFNGGGSGSSTNPGDSGSGSST